MPSFLQQSPFCSDDVSPKSELRLADLGFSHWETSWNRPSLSNKYFETFLARPRNSEGSFSFFLKALRPEYCGSSVGVALIERERAVGSISCRRLAQVVDFAYPRRITQQKATRGFLVFPRFQGRALIKYLNATKPIDSTLLSRIKIALSEIIASLNRFGWSFDSITPSEVFVSEDNVSLFDYSNLYRFSSASLFSESLELQRELNVSFDPSFRLLPTAFVRKDLRSDASLIASRRLLSVLSN